MRTIKLIFFIPLIALAISCSDDKVVDSNTPLSQYAGVNEYDENGSKTKEVDNDWQPECYQIPNFGENHICFYATYPLPATDTLTLWLASAIQGRYKIWLALNDSTIALDLLDKVQPIGDIKIKIPFDEDKLHKNIVYRVFVESTDLKTNKTQLHFGDVIWK